MKSFDVALEASATPRLAAMALVVHVAAAASPWLARAAPWFAVPISLLALLGFASTLQRLPGRHCEFAALVIDARGCRVRHRGRSEFLAGELGPGSRAYPWLVLADIRVGARHTGWLLPRGSVDTIQFRRLKARIRLSC